jgi:hypothetical protein
VDKAEQGVMSDKQFDGELRLFLEELCCDLCRMRHITDDHVGPEELKIAREV